MYMYEYVHAWSGACKRHALTGRSVSSVQLWSTVKQSSSIDMMKYSLHMPWLQPKSTAEKLPTIFNDA